MYSHICQHAWLLYILCTLLSYGIHEMKTAMHGTDEGRSRVKGIDCSAPGLPEMETEKPSHRSILCFLCPLTLPLGLRTQGLSIVRRSITLHAGMYCEEFTWLRSKTSRDIWQISCEIGDCRCQWRRKLWKKLDAASWFESFLSLSLEHQRSAGKTARTLGHPCSTGAKSWVRSSFGRAGEHTVALKWGGRTDRARIKALWDPLGSVLMHKCVSHVRPSSEENHVQACLGWQVFSVELCRTPGSLYALPFDQGFQIG